MEQTNTPQKWTLTTEQIAEAVQTAYNQGLQEALQSVTRAGYHYTKRDRIHNFCIDPGTQLNQIVRNTLTDTPEARTFLPAPFEE